MKSTSFMSLTLTLTFLMLSKKLAIFGHAIYHKTMEYCLQGIFCPANEFSCNILSVNILSRTKFSLGRLKTLEFSLWKIFNPAKSLPHFSVWNFPHGILFHGIYLLPAEHLMVSLYLCSSGSNARGELRAQEERRVSSKSPSRVRDGDEGVAGRNGRE